MAFDGLTSAALDRPEGDAFAQVDEWEKQFHQFWLIEDRDWENWQLGFEELEQ